jgi:hypothetical protein
MEKTARTSNSFLHEDGSNKCGKQQGTGYRLKASVDLGDVKHYIDQAAALLLDP